MFISPNHIRLIAACYPASPLAAAPDFKPNNQELSRLTYYGSNRPGKLTKLGGELEKRAQADARRASSSPKSRASLLITLEILKALCAECRNDVSSLARSVMASVDAVITALPTDLEVLARAASLFTNYTTFTDGKIGGADEVLVKTYLGVLSKFANLSIWQGPRESDPEVQNRMRLVGLAAISGAVSSDALYSSVEGAQSQVEIIVPALLHNAQQASVDVLKEQEALVEASTASTSAYFSEFQPQRPVAQRRAASIHLHVDGETGPTFTDVVYASLNVAKRLLSRSDSEQVSTFLRVMLSSLSSETGWENVELCQWLALNAAEWTQYQHRYAVPVGLIQKLADTKDEENLIRMQASLIAMITAVLSSPSPIANLSTSESLTHLVNVLLRRVSLNPNDALLTPLVDCISSLGCHLYYPDQINDLAEELVHRIINVQLNSRSTSESTRQESIRCLLACLTGLIHVVTESSSRSKETESPVPGSNGASTNGTARQSEPSSSKPATPAVVASRRNPISPEVWQRSLALLCESEYAIRADYARALVMFIRTDIPHENLSSGELSPLNGSSSNRRSVAHLEDDETARFFHALHASAYSLAISPALGLASPPSSSGTPSLKRQSSPMVSGEPETTDAPDTFTGINVIAATPVGTPNVTNGSGEHFPPQITSRKSPFATTTSTATSTSASFESPNQHHLSRPPPKRTSSRTRTASLAMSFLEPAPAFLQAAAPAPATPSDYSHILAILTSAFERAPARMILSGVPMLLAMDAATTMGIDSVDDTVAHSRRKAVREVVARVWAVIGRVLGSEEIQQIASEALLSLDPTIIPESTSTPIIEPHLRAPTLPQHFPSQLNPEWTTPSSLPPIVDPETLLTHLASSSKLRIATMLDRQTILQRLNIRWSVESALHDAVKGSSASTRDRRGSRADGSTTPFLKLTTPLMNIDNRSLASLARSMTRDVGVGDLREVLEGGRSSTALGYTQSYAPSLSSAGRASSAVHRQSIDGNANGDDVHHHQARGVADALKGSGEVKDILNKLGIGKHKAHVGALPTRAASSRSLSTRRANNGSPNPNFKAPAVPRRPRTADPDASAASVAV